MIKIFFYFFLVTILLYAETSKEIANRLGGQASIKYGSRSALQNNITTPMRTNQPLKTLNGTSFNANLTGCVSTYNNIKLSFSSNSNTVFSVEINQDTYTSTKNNIVGVCSNGFITNSNSSWQPDHLIHKKWIYDSINNKITTANVDSSELSQCECTTYDCGYTSFGKAISDIIVSGIISSISNTNTNITLGSIEYDNNIYNISMTNNSNCNPTNRYTGTDPKSYYNSQTTPPIDNATVNLKDGNDPTSLYNIISTQNSVVVDPSNHNIKTPNLNECHIKYEINNDDNSLQANKKDTCNKFDNNNSCTLRNKIICDYDGINNCIYSIKNGTATNSIISSHCITVGNKTVCDDGQNIKVFENGIALNSIVTGNDSFFYIKKIYDCGMEDNSIDRSNVNRTISSVSVNDSTKDFTYTNKDGEETYLTTLSDNECIIRWCSVKETTVRASEFSDNTNNSDTQDGSTTNPIAHKQCSEESLNNFVCPLNENDVLVEDCSCDIGNAGLNQTLGGLSAVKSIVGDFTCSN